MARTLRLSLVSERHEARKLRKELRRWLLEAGINGSTVAEIMLAANEAFINAVEHPLQRRSGQIEISGRVGDGHVVIRVGDDGRWQDYADRSRDHYGQLLMEALMSSVRVQRRETGTTVVLTRLLPSGRMGQEP